MNLNKAIIFVTWLFITFDAAAFDYKTLSHRVFLDSLRSGNENESGENHYLFTLRHIAFRNVAADYFVEIAQRLQLPQKPEQIGEVKIPVLTQWQPSNPQRLEENIFLMIDGDIFRKLVAEGMRTWNVVEKDVAVMTEIKMLSRAKKFWFFSDNVEVGTTRYFPIPAAEEHAPMRTNVKVEITDQKSTHAIFKVIYNTTSEGK